MVVRRGWEVGVQGIGWEFLRCVIPAWCRKWSCLRMVLEWPRGPREVLPNCGWFFQWLYCCVPKALETIPTLPGSLRVWVRSLVVF